MNAENYRLSKDRLFDKIYRFLEDIWPTVYRLINNFFWGTIDFIKWLVSGLWRRS